MNTMLKKRILRRVYVVYVLRRLFSPALVKVYILAALVWQASQRVSIGDVIANAPGFNIAQWYTFSTWAFLHTEVLIQASVVAGAALVFWLLWDVLRYTPHSHQHV